MSRAGLVESPRWRALVAFVAQWYAEPLRPEHGNTPEEIRLAETLLGTTLPAVLQEWYTLVGRRLDSIQDHARSLEELEPPSGGLIDVCIENQGVWKLSVPVQPDDPDVVIDDPSFGGARGPLSMVLMGMLASETLVGSWAARGKGMLGMLQEDVVGGYLDEVDSGSGLVAQLHERYQPLPWPTNPFFPEPCCGDGSTVIRVSDMSTEWITADVPAYERLAAILPLDPVGGMRELVVVVQQLTQEEVRRFLDGAGRPDMGRFRRSLGELGHLASLRIGLPEGTITMRVKTREPLRVWQALRNALDPALLARVTAAQRPEAVARFEVLFPAAGQRFVPPD
jgi:hypothetical protein